VKKTKKIDNPGGILLDPLMTRPSRIAIVALGPSCQSFIGSQMANPGMLDPYDEVWTLNRGIRGFHHDKLFVMDDLRWIERKRNKGYAKFLKNHDKPIITSTVYEEYPMSVPYPLHMVQEFIDDDIFAMNTVSYMVAYAMYIRVKEFTLFGADFVYPNGNTAEEGGMAVAYLLGRCKMYDITHGLPGTTTMIYANKVKQWPDGSVRRPYYGYHRLDELAAEKKQETDRKAAQGKVK
jgi:hypothetical protein